MNVKDNRTNQAKDPTDSMGASRADALRPGATQSAQALRKHAEEIQRQRMSRSWEELAGMPPEETRRMLYELQVHQIELELQNEDLRQTQVELAAARARYFDLYDLAPVGYITISAQGVILESNLTAGTLLGAPRSMLVGQPVSRFIADECQDVFYLFHKQLLETGKPQVCEVSMVKIDAPPFRARLQATTTPDLAGIPECQLILCDISETRQAEEELRQQTAALVAAHAKMEHEQRLLAAVMEALPIGVAITDPLGGTIQTNAAYEQIWGGPRPETRSVEDYSTYKAWLDDTGKPVAPEEWASALAIRKGEATVGQMIRLQRFDNSEIFVINSASPVYDSEGNIVGSAVAIQDVTELKRTEQALLENREDFARAQEVGSIGSWRLDVRQNVLTWSDENHRIFGIPKGTPLGYQDFLAIVHPEDRAYVDTQWQAGLRGKPYDIVHRIVINGQIKWVREQAYLEYDKDGTLAGGFGITQDITKRKIAEELIKQQVEELLIINEDMEKFNNAAVGRELRMIELKKEINELCRQTGQPPRYPLDFDEDSA
ncbi:MAG: PAS domain S-box protein [Chlorobium sp.]|nr:PAS domain S-box protein [Chlorobium sp.]